MRLLVALVIFQATAALHAVSMLPPGTNDLVAFHLATEARDQNHLYYLSGKVDRMEHEMERLELGFLAVSVLVLSVLVSVGLLAARDHLRARKRQATGQPQS